MTDSLKAGERSVDAGAHLTDGLSHASRLRRAQDFSARLTPAGLQRRSTLLRRRIFMLIVNLTTYAGLLALVTLALSGGGLSWIDVGILACVALSAPWTILGFWNAVVGLWLLRVARRPLARVAPVWRARDMSGPISARTALLMAIRNENVEDVFVRLSAMRAGLDAEGHGAAYDIHVLSDTSDAEIAAEEERVFAERREALAGQGAAFYRRRADNAGFKAGNVREWVDRAGSDYDFMITLDADSLMGARLINRMTRAMQRLPRLGILQSLAVGAPAESGFARLFQFGMRHGMRSFTMGSAWWQGDCGPYWGHNAVIRVAAFRDHCRLPELGGKPPFGGPILSHDQVEAAMMRAAGYEVRVTPVEDASWEENPVTILDFIKREQRWCNGNMQYAPLLRMPGLTRVSRFQLLQAIMMYLGSPAWMLMTLLAAAKAAGLDAETVTPVADEAASVDIAGFDAIAAGAVFPAGAADPASLFFALGAGLFFVMFAMSLAPKAAGVIDVALEPGGMARYGGTWRFVRGVFLEIVFGILIAPVVALHLTIFLIGLVLGRGGSWTGQVRDAYGLAWSTAAAKLWPQTLLGVGLLIVVASSAPALLPWAAPVLAGLVLAVPVAVLTASPWFGRALTRRGLAAVPEERATPPMLARVRAAAAARGEVS